MQKAKKFIDTLVIDLGYFGDYRLGLTTDEIKEYLGLRKNTKSEAKINKLYKEFNRIAGVNTVGVGPDGQSLMYRHDVERFADKLFLNKPTYFD